MKVIDINKCPRCKYPHYNIRIRLMTNTDVNRYFAMCPNLNEPIILESVTDVFVEDETGISIRVRVTQ